MPQRNAVGAPGRRGDAHADRERHAHREARAARAAPMAIAMRTGVVASSMRSDHVGRDEAEADHHEQQQAERHERSTRHVRRGRPAR